MSEGYEVPTELPGSTGVQQVISTIDPLHTPWEDQSERHRMIRMARPDGAVICNWRNTHTHIDNLTALEIGLIVADVRHLFRQRTLVLLQNFLHHLGHLRA